MGGQIELNSVLCDDTSTITAFEYVGNDKYFIGCGDGNLYGIRLLDVRTGDIMDLDGGQDPNGKVVISPPQNEPKGIVATDQNGDVCSPIICTMEPTAIPTQSPSAPTLNPTQLPSNNPTTSEPTNIPSAISMNPSTNPSKNPTAIVDPTNDDDDLESDTNASNNDSEDSDGEMLIPQHNRRGHNKLRRDDADDGMFVFLYEFENENDDKRKKYNVVLDFDESLLIALWGLFGGFILVFCACLCRQRYIKMKA